MLLFVFLNIFYFCDQQATIGVDFGGNYIKVSSVSMSRPIDTVLDRDSRRKTLAYIGFKDGYIVFAEAAKAHERKFPSQVVRHLDRLLGRKFSDPSIEKYRALHPFTNLTEDLSSGGILVNFLNLTLTPIELLSIIFNEIQLYSKLYTGYDISEFSIAFPPVFDISRVSAIKDAAQISKLKLLEIRDTSSTVCTNYILNNRKLLSSTLKVVMFVDIGSTNTVVTVSRVGLEPGSKKNTTIGAYNIIGESFIDVGGDDFDFILTNSFIQDFKKNHKINKQIEENKKIYGRFQDKAISAKHCLTSSKECRVMVEEAYEDLNYQTSINRDMFKQLGADSLEKISEAIERGIQSAKISAKNLSEVVLMGGGSLMYVVQEIIEKITGLTPSRVLNTDESNAAGASILAAKAHKLFTVAEFKSPAANYYPIEIEYNATVKDSEGNLQNKHIKETLYGHLAKQSAKKVLTISNLTEDLEIHVRYGDFPAHLFNDVDSKSLMKVKITGIPEILQRNSNQIPKHLAVHFRIDAFRILNVHSVDYVFEKNVTGGILSKMGKAVKNLLGMNSEKNDTNDTVTETGVNETNNTDHNNTKKENISFPVQFKVELMYLPPLTKDEIDKSKKTIKEIEKREKARQKTIKARSDLEGAIYANENIINSGELKEYFTEEEYQEFINTTTTIREAFDMEGYKYDEETSKLKMTEIKSAIEIAEFRKQEIKDVETSNATLNNLINTTRTLINQALSTEPWNKIMNQTILEEALNKTIHIENWILNKSEEQSKLNFTAKRVLTYSGLQKKIREMEEIGQEIYGKMKEANDLLEKVKKQIESGNFQIPKDKTEDKTAPEPTDSSKTTEDPPKPSTDEPEAKTEEPKLDL